MNLKHTKLTLFLAGLLNIVASTLNGFSGNNTFFIMNGLFAILSFGLLLYIKKRTR